MFSFKSAKTTAVAGVLVLGSAVGFATDASAASANALATINWASFTITPIGAVEITFGALADTTVASAASNGINPLVTAGPNVSPNWDDSSFASAETGNPHYNGNSTAQTPGFNVGTQALTGAFQSESHTFADHPGWTVNVGSTATRGLDFTVSGSGLVAFSVDYTLFADAGDGGTSIANDTASAVARVSALLRNLTNNATPIGTSTANISASFQIAALNFGSSDSAATCTAEPRPTGTLNFPGLALASAISSCTFFTGTLGCAASTCAEYEIIATGVKTRMMSKGSLVATTSRNANALKLKHSRNVCRLTRRGPILNVGTNRKAQQT